MRASVSLNTEFGQEEARRREESCARRQREERAQKWSHARATISAAFIKTAKLVILALLATLAYIHRDELQRTFQFYSNRLAVNRVVASNSGSLQQGAFHHEDEINQASQ